MYRALLFTHDLHRNMLSMSLIIFFNNNYTTVGFRDIKIISYVYGLDNVAEVL